mgnify:CR=1 FL=1|jgi:hypothetical protein
MKIKNKKLVWNVLLHDFNSDKIITYNVFSDEFKENLYKEYRKKKINNKLELKEYIKSKMMYHYWSRSEYEIAVGGLHSKYPENFEKIDAYHQLEMNLDHIVDYINDYLEMNLD